MQNVFDADPSFVGGSFENNYGQSIGDMTKGAVTCAVSAQVNRFR